MEELPESKSHKVFVLVLAMSLVLLMLTYLILPVSDIIKGQVYSFPVKNDVIITDSFKIFFLNNSDTVLEKIYLDEQGTEFSVCLKGYIRNSYFITGLYQPLTFSRSYSHVNSEPCSEDSLIMLHSHPYKSCLPSSTDLNTYTQAKRKNVNLLMVVMCEPRRFFVYS